MIGLADMPSIRDRLRILTAQAESLCVGCRTTDGQQVANPDQALHEFNLNLAKLYALTIRGLRVQDSPNYRAG